jgi:hypothetical protein
MLSAGKNIPAKRWRWIEPFPETADSADRVFVIYRAMLSYVWYGITKRQLSPRQLNQVVR